MKTIEIIFFLFLTAICIVAFVFILITNFSMMRTRAEISKIKFLAIDEETGEIIK